MRPFLLGSRSRTRPGRYLALARNGPGRDPRGWLAPSSGPVGPVAGGIPGPAGPRACRQPRARRRGTYSCARSPPSFRSRGLRRAAAFVECLGRPWHVGRPALELFDEPRTEQFTSRPSANVEQALDAARVMPSPVYQPLRISRLACFSMLHGTAPLSRTRCPVGLALAQVRLVLARATCWPRRVRQRSPARSPVPVAAGRHSRLAYSAGIPAFSFGRRS